ncbi:amidase [Microbacteriaceae bacterium VKM Ac-2854]|nr:amidase [Microbacteriaceae bacterium VKM Ac-2854]
MSQTALRVGPATLVEGAATGPLAGTGTVVKDLFDVAGQRTGAGNPDWLAAAAVNESSAWAVQALVDAGAGVIGIAHSDELAFSLSGTNVHYGTPPNPRAPGRIPGGSSSGSASAVASGLVDYALATDTGGSTRIPASYTGTFGLRPTHGRLPMDGVVGLAPRYDTVGVLASSGEWLRAAGSVLLEAAGESRPAEPLSMIVLATDLLALADPDTAEAVSVAAVALAERLGVPMVVREFVGAETLADWKARFMAGQMAAIWATHGEWVTATDPSFGPGVGTRMNDARAADPDRQYLADEGRTLVRSAIDAALPAGAVLAFASASGPAPLIELDAAAKGALRSQTIGMTCVAGLGGLPAVSLPLAEVDGLPVGLCLVGRPFDDELLLQVAAAS